MFRRAKEVEKAVHANEGDGPGYRNKIRSLFVNLKDKNNPDLRESVVSGDLPAEKFAVMTSEEMASEERKAELKKIKEANLFNALSAQETEAETTAFQCSKCKQVRGFSLLVRALLMRSAEKMQVQAGADAICRRTYDDLCYLYGMREQVEVLLAVCLSSLGTTLSYSTLLLRFRLLFSLSDSPFHVRRCRLVSPYNLLALILDYPLSRSCCQSRQVYGKFSAQKVHFGVQTLDRQVSTSSALA